MKHTVLPLLTLALGTAIGSSAPPLAQQSRGSYFSYNAETSYDMAVAVDPSGNPRVPEPLVEARQVWVVPDFYGEPFAVTRDDTGYPTVWYRAGDGTVRNATAGVNTIAVERRSASDVEVDVVRR